MSNHAASRKLYYTVLLDRSPRHPFLILIKCKLYFVSASLCVFLDNLQVKHRIFLFLPISHPAVDFLPKKIKYDPLSRFYFQPGFMFFFTRLLFSQDSQAYCQNPTN